MFRQALKRLEKPDIELRVQFVEMKSLRRFKATGAEYFITAVTFNREPLLHHSLEMFWQSWGEVQLTAWVVLPEHFHALLSPGNESISEVIHRFKITYSRRFRDAFRSGQVWQNRFWDHVIRDQDNLNRHIDYIHYNPVHHGLALDPFMVEYSSADSWLQKGFYSRDWGVEEKPELDGEYGE